MSSPRKVAALALLVILSIPLFGKADTTTQTLGTQTLVAVGGPYVDALGFLAITYKNNLNATLTGIVFLVMHNARGQTVRWDTATIAPEGGASVKAYLVPWGEPAGVYNATIFVVALNGVAISDVTSMAYTAH